MSTYIVDFKEQSNVKIFIYWINSPQEYFSSHNMGDPQRVNFVKIKLKGYAEIWWHNVDNDNIVWGLSPIKLNCYV